MPFTLLLPGVPGLDQVALRYQQQLAFFAPAMADESVHLDEVNEVVLTQGLRAVLDRMVRQFEEMTPAREHYVHAVDVRALICKP